MAAGVFVGLSTLDLIHSIEEFPPPDTKTVARSQELVVGGPATNAAIAFRHLGARAALVTAVSRHRLATIIKDELRRYSIELVDLMLKSDDLPAISSVWVDGHGRRSVVSVNASHLDSNQASDLASKGVTSSPHVDLAILANARVLLVDGHLMQAGCAWARAAHSAGVQVVLDGGSWKKGTDELLEFVDSAICSAEFMPPGCSNHDEVVRYLQMRNVKHIAITRGAEPIRFLDDSRAGTIPVPRVEVLDTNGAGDILHGAFCYYASGGRGFVESLRDAAAVASESCRYPGTRRWMQGV